MSARWMSSGGVVWAVMYSEIAGSSHGVFASEATSTTLRAAWSVTVDPRDGSHVYFGNESGIYTVEPDDNNESTEPETGDKS